MLAYWILYAIAPGLHKNMIQGEDHLVEWMTFIFFLCSSFFTLSIIYISKHAMRRLSLFFFICMSFFFIVCSGEEISWGQRILGFETPKSVAEINEQGEFNMHNLQLEHFHPKDIISWFMKIYGIILPLMLLKKYSGPINKIKLYISSPLLAPCYLFPEVLNLVEDQHAALMKSFFGKPGYRIVTGQTEEIIEMYWAWCIMLSMMVIYRNWQSVSKASSTV